MGPAHVTAVAEAPELLPSLLLAHSPGPHPPPLQLPLNLSSSPPSSSSPPFPLPSTCPPLRDPCASADRSCCAEMGETGTSGPGAREKVNPPAKFEGEILKGYMKEELIFLCFMFSHKA